MKLQHSCFSNQRTLKSSSTKLFFFKNAEADEPYCCLHTLYREPYNLSATLLVPEAWDATTTAGKISYRHNTNPEAWDATTTAGKINYRHNTNPEAWGATTISGTTIIVIKQPLGHWKLLEMLQRKR